MTGDSFPILYMVGMPLYAQNRLFNLLVAIRFSMIEGSKAVLAVSFFLSLASWLLCSVVGFVDFDLNLVECDGRDDPDEKVRSLMVRS